MEENEGDKSEKKNWFREEVQNVDLRTENGWNIIRIKADRNGCTNLYHTCHMKDISFEAQYHGDMHFWKG